ncbi:MAG: 7-cyano-7-deazaguanine synthase [Myxococcota bacterium]|nr:7-cyano-7-deazaguanine synthase [Myxococcota bacterium]
MTPPPAIVLVSGGLDSATTLAIAQSEGFSVHALSMDYGQRHRIELECAHRVVRAAGVREHSILTLDLRSFGGSALTSELAVPKDRAAEDIARGVPITYVPARNTILLSYALALAEVKSAQDIFIGVNAVDYSGYPDCRPEYIAAFERMANLATKAAVQDGRSLRIHTPLIAWTKGQIIRRGLELGVDYSLTSSCYDPAPDGAACGRCDSCQLRLKGFADAGACDPIRYSPAV